MRGTKRQNMLSKHLLNVAENNFFPFLFFLPELVDVHSGQKCALRCETDAGSLADRQERLFQHV